MSTIYRVGIAGHGTVGRIRHRVCNAHPNLHVVAVCDQSLDIGVTEGGVRTWTTFEQLLEEELDVLFVCLPNYMVPDVTIAGLHKGLHIFCEKPPGRDVSDIRRVIEVHKGYPDQRLMYGFNHRYHDSVMEALSIIQSGELGRVLDMRGVYGKSKIIQYDRKEWRCVREKSGGGILLDQGIHMLDLMRLFAGEFTQVTSHISSDFWGHDVEDNAWVLMRTEDGKVAMLHSSATQWRHHFRLEINLSKGALVLSGLLTSTRSYGAEQLTVRYPGEDDRGDPQETTWRFNQDPSWEREVADFVKAVQDGTPIKFGTSDEALKTMQLVYRIYCADPVWKARHNLSEE